MAASAVWNNGAGAANPLTNANSTNSAQGSTAATTNDASISANDFLTLLVTELKNQDPTANTDPNQYINQLVQVNSLEQLISINQTLTAEAGTSTASSGHAAQAEWSGSPQSQPNNGTPGVSARTTANTNHPETTGYAAGAVSNPPGINDEVPVQVTSGNLSIPPTSPTAHRVALALGGRN